MGNLFHIFAGVASAAVLLLASCTKPSGGEEQDLNQLQFTDSLYLVPAEGGKFSMGYTVNTPVGGAGLSATCTADWVDGISVSDTAVHFVVTPWDGKEARSTAVLLRYVYGSTMLAAEAVLEQSGLGYDVRLEAVEYDGLYTIGSDTLYTEVYFSDATLGMPGTTTLWLKVPMFNDEAGSRGLTEGEWHVGTDGAYGTITDALYFKTNEAGDDFETAVPLTEGSLTVTAAEEGWLYSGTFTGEDGLVYDISCASGGGLRDLTAASTLMTDMLLDLTDGETCQATWHGMMSRAHAWSVLVAEPDGYGDKFEITLYTAETDLSRGIPDGVYTPSDQRTAGTFFLGQATATLRTGAWYTHNYRTGACDGPIVGGTITVTNHPDGTVTLDFDCLDDAVWPHRITGVWTGKPKYEEDIVMQ